MKNVLILTAGSLGDSICRIPSLKQIKKKNQNSNLIILVNKSIQKGIPGAKEVFLNLKGINKIYEYDIHSNFLKKILLIKKIKKIEDIKIVFYLMPERTNFQLSRDYILFKLLGFEDIYGFHYGYNSKIQEWKRLLVLNNLKSKITTKDFSFDISKQEIKKNFIKFNLDEDIRLVVSIGTKVCGQLIDPQLWIDLLNRLNDEKSIKIVFIGNENDWKLTNYISKKLKFDTTNLCGKTNIVESYSILKIVGNFFGYDSGPMHLAVSAGCKIVSLFSDQSPVPKWYPFGNEKNVIRINSKYKNMQENNENDKTINEIWSKLSNTINN